MGHPSFIMHRIGVILMIACLWGSMFYGALSINKLDLGYLPIVCGPWGCLAGVAPLLSIHSMWFVLLGGAFSLTRWAVPKLHSRKIWFVASSIGLCGLLGMWIFEYVSFINSGGRIATAVELLKFSTFHAIRWTDLPIIEILLSSAVHALIPWASFSRAPDSSLDNLGGQSA